MGYCGEAHELPPVGKKVEDEGELPAVGGFDDDQRRSLVESEHLFRTLTEKALVGVYIIQNGLFSYVNPALARIFGYEPDEIIGHMGPLALVHPEDRQLVAGNIARRLTGEIETSHYFLRGVRKNGVEIVCEVVGRRAEYEGKPAIIGTLLDITERRRAEEAEQEQRNFAEALRDIATVLNSTLDLDQVLKRILDNVERVVPHDGVNIVLIAGTDAQVVRCQGHYRELPDGDITGLRLPLDQFPHFRAMMRAGKPWISADTASDPEWLKVKRTEWIASYLAAPIMREGRVLGFLNLDSKVANFFTPTHAERLQAFADQVAIALQNARLFQELEKYSESLELAVTARTTELQRALGQLVVTLDNSPDPILLLRRDGSIERGNPAFYEAFGYERGGLDRVSLARLVAPAGSGLLRDALAGVVEDGQKRRLELVGLRQDHSTFDIDVALAPVRENGQVHGIVCSLRDISRLKEVDRMKDAFVSNVSHELRTPITSLKLYHDLLRRNPERREVYLGRLEREIDRLSLIVEDLLRLSRLDREQVTMRSEPVDLNQLVSQYIEDRVPLAHSRDLSLSWEATPGLPTVQADARLLEQVVSILLSNALSYTPAGGHICVALRQREKEECRWVGCEVRDSGPGIPDAEIPYLFERFFRGELARETSTSGTGLGLAIAHEIVSRHQGEIEVYNQSGEESGAVFTVWLPCG